MNPGTAARGYLRRHHRGMLSTISARMAGYPFGSVVAFVLDHVARPVFLISRLAEHTRNIGADGRVSLLVNDPAADPQAGSRLTVVGDASQVEEDAALKERYLAFFPDARRLFALGDFALYRIEPRRLRWIGGFGDIEWIEAEAYRAPDGPLWRQERDIVMHMNSGHLAALRDYCRHFHGRTPAEPQMVGIDCDGFDVRSDGETLRFAFDAPVTEAMDARAALVAMARTARGE